MAVPRILIEPSPAFGANHAPAMPSGRHIAFAKDDIFGPTTGRWLVRVELSFSLVLS